MRQSFEREWLEGMGFHPVASRSEDEFGTRIKVEAYAVDPDMPAPTTINPLPRQLPVLILQDQKFLDEEPEEQLGLIGLMENRMYASMIHQIRQRRLIGFLDQYHGFPRFYLAFGQLLAWRQRGIKGIELDTLSSPV